jgi:hypothetical protein
VCVCVCVCRERERERERKREREREKERENKREEEEEPCTELLRRAIELSLVDYRTVSLQSTFEKDKTSPRSTNSSFSEFSLVENKYFSL